MKKVLFSIFFFSLLAVGVNAQKSSCSKTCTTKVGATADACKGKSASVASIDGTETNAAAAKLASMDASIESRTCPVSGTVSYVRKETSGNSKNVSYVDVTYDASTNTFVNVSPVKMEGAHSGCGSAKATSASGKGCCAGTAAAGKACCAEKGKAASASKTADGKAIKTSGSVEK